MQTLSSDLPLDSRLDLTGKVTRIGEHAQKSGGFSDIWEGRHEGEKVAVKVIREVNPSFEKLSRRLIREVQAWSKLHHRNVLPLYGYTYKFGRRLPSLVSPWMPNGTATEYLKDKTMAERLRVITQVADGLSYLHRHKVIHGDLKASNIIMTAAGDPRLSDFGLSTLVNEDTSVVTVSFSGSVRWMAPELVRGEETCDYETDTWAYGMTLLELLTCQLPYHYLRNEYAVIMALQSCTLPRPPPEISEAYEDVWGLCLECWKEPPDRRSSMRAIARRMGNFELMYRQRGKRPSQVYDADSEWTDSQGSVDSFGPRKSPRLDYPEEFAGDLSSGSSSPYSSVRGLRPAGSPYPRSSSSSENSTSEQHLTASPRQLVKSSSELDPYPHKTYSPRTNSAPTSRGSPRNLSGELPRAADTGSRSSLGLVFDSPSGSGVHFSGPSSPEVYYRESSPRPSPFRHAPSSSSGHTPSPLRQPTYPPESPTRYHQRTIQNGSPHGRLLSSPYNVPRNLPRVDHRFVQHPGLFSDFLPLGMTPSPFPSLPSSPAQQSPQRMLDLEDLIANNYFHDESDFTLVGKDFSGWKDPVPAAHGRKTNEPTATRPVDFTTLPPVLSSPALSDLGLTSTPMQRHDSLPDGILDSPSHISAFSRRDDSGDLGDFADLDSFPEEHGGSLTLFGGIDIHDQYDYGRRENVRAEALDNITPRVSPSRRHEMAFVLHAATPSPHLSPRFLT